jgi:GNAT superfamily N-acetyltransferase
MSLHAQPVAVEAILPWRERYRTEMGCQIVHDSLHARVGWTEPYLLRAEGALVGYGSLLVGGPWRGTRTVFEFYVAPEHRVRSAELFAALITVSGGNVFCFQTNDVQAMALLASFGREIATERIVFADRSKTTLTLEGARVRRVTAADAPKLFAHREEPIGEWLVELDGVVAATGGIALHYNRPYGDLYLEVAEAFRRRGIGSFLLQELKRISYEQGNIPGARCRPENLASCQTLRRAGFVPCAEILNGKISPAV